MSSPDAYDIMRTYGCLAPTTADHRAYVGVLDRMGAFAASERAILVRAGLLGAADRPADASGEVGS